MADDTNDRDEAAVRAWWDELTRRDAAALRHCRSLLEVAMHRQGLALARTLSWSKYRPRHAAGLAQILAHVTEDIDRPIMERCGFESWGADGSALLSERRYERLVSTRDVDELTTGLIRLVRMMEGKSNVAELGRWMRWWPRDGDTASFNRTLRAIAEVYYAAPMPADDATLLTSEE